MIKVNLAAVEKKPSKASAKVAARNFTPLLLIVTAFGFAAAGFWWYSRLAGQAAALDEQIKQAEAQKAALEAVIKQDQIYEARKKALEHRVKVVESLQKNQVSPVFVLDQLAEAIDKTQFVWLSSLDQKDAILNMSGTGTSLNAIADFYSNLSATGYFRNIDLGPSQETAGNYTFSLKCEFSMPRTAATAGQPATVGGN